MKRNLTARLFNSFFAACLCSSAACSVSPSYAAVASPVQACPTGGSAVGQWQQLGPAIDWGAQPPVSGQPCCASAMEVAVDPTNTSTIYMATAYRGLWRSQDCGATWVKRNTGRNAATIDGGILWTFAIDPANPQVMYTATGYGEWGLWQSTNGGVDFDQILPTSGGNYTVPGADIYNVSIDPWDHNHIILTAHAATLWNANDAGVLEGKYDSTKGWTWTPHPAAAGMGQSNYAFFLDNSRTWLVIGMTGTNSGTWRTTDSGVHWQKVSSFEHPHGNCSLYRSPVNGAFYFGTLGNGVARSTDGINWSSVTDPTRGQSLFGLVGDGINIYASDNANPLQYAPENPGTSWSFYSTQTSSFDYLAADPQRNILYAASGRGTWRLITR
jgi:hypothetical protein